jgi:Domain of unknown function (DUF1990)
MRERLRELSDRPVNYDVGVLDLEHPPADWTIDDRRQPLPPEPPGGPVAGGSFEIARRLIKGYEFADPSIVRAYYEAEDPYPGRDMLLELRTLGAVKIHVGVRVCDVYDDSRTVAAREVRVFGWSYHTLEGHVERGQMDGRSGSGSTVEKLSSACMPSPRRPRSPIRSSASASGCCAAASAGCS